MLCGFRIVHYESRINLEFRSSFSLSLFDEEGDGLIKWYNYRTIEKVLLSQTKMGRDHRDHADYTVHVHKVLRSLNDLPSRISI